MFGLLIREDIYLLRRLMKYYKDRKRDMYMVFVNMEKVYDKVFRDVLWRCLEKWGFIWFISELLEIRMKELR